VPPSPGASGDPRRDGRLPPGSAGHVCTPAGDDRGEAALGIGRDAAGAPGIEDDGVPDAGLEPGLVDGDRGPTVERTADPADGRRRTVVVTPAGREVLRLSAEVFEQLRAERERQVGVARMRETEEALRRLDRATTLRVDAAAWLGG
jgi:hypothetical protein